MELSSSNIKKSYYISTISGNKPPKKNFVLQEMKTLKKLLIFPEMKPCTFQPKVKNFLYFRKRKLLKNFVYFLKRKLFLYFGKQKPQKMLYVSGNGNPKKLFVFQEVAWKMKLKKKQLWKNFLYFRIQEKKLSYISRVIKTNFLIFLVLKDKRNSCFFPRRTPQGFWFFTFRRCFHFSPFRFFHFSPFPSIFNFRLSQVFHFSPFSGAFVLYCECYGFERVFLTIRRFLPYTQSPHLPQYCECYASNLAQPAFVKASLGTSSCSLKVAGPPFEVHTQTNPSVWLNHTVFSERY